jgi:2-polyprenyl-3-methyl-5-hydroxy-6-metoxy-1,4-benzoquinol methylase
MRNAATTKTAAEYDAFARAYDRYFSERLAALQRGEYTRSTSLEALFEHREPTAILDCACGPGHLALELAHRGYLVVGTDISREMIRIAKQHAREFHLPARFAVCAWADLPQKVRRQFGLVLCAGNAIGHCRNGREMIRALRAMHDVLKPGGVLHLDTRWWERYRESKDRFSTFRAKTVDGERLIWLNVRHYPRRFQDPHLIEVVVVTVGADGATSTESFPVTYYPFRVGELKRRLRAAGFRDLEVGLRGDAWYSVTAQRP